MIGYIYKIENTINNKIYVGSTKDLIKRKSRHKKALQNNNHYNQHLQNAYNIDKGHFRFVIIEECKIEEILVREQYYIDLLKPEYNINKIASFNNGSAISHGKKGKRMKESSIRKMKYTKMGMKHSIESNNRRSLTMLGKNAGSNNRRSIPIVQLELKDKELYLIKEWSSRNEIKKELGFDGVRIQKVCKRRDAILLRPYGFIWMFKQNVIIMENNKVDIADKASKSVMVSKLFTAEV